MALHKTGDIVAATLGDRPRVSFALRGAAMSMDEGIAYALSNIDPRQLTGPMASIDG